MSYPKKKCETFKKCIFAHFPVVIERKREKGFSVFLKSHIDKRWMMVDVNDSEKYRNPHLFIVLDCHQNDFEENELTNMIHLPALSETKGSSNLSLNTNKDAIHLRLYEDEDGELDFESDSFLLFLEQAQASFIKSRIKYT